jgi:hypothetical protein
MSNDEVVNELKEKKLPTFGTLVERKERLKKHYGIYIKLDLISLIGLIVALPDGTLKDGTNTPINVMPTAAAAAVMK